MTVYVCRTKAPFTKETHKERDRGRLSEEIKSVKFSGISLTPDHEVCSHHFHIHPCL